MTFHFLCFQEFTMHDTIGCYLDIDKGHVKFSKNGKNIYDSCFSYSVVKSSALVTYLLFQWDLFCEYLLCALCTRK